MNFVANPYGQNLIPEIVADYVGSDDAYLYEEMRLGMIKSYKRKEFASNAYDLPEIITIYRGTNDLLMSGEAFEDGCIPFGFEMSWTLNKDKAAYFASRNASFTKDSKPMVMEMSIPREMVMFYVGGDEEEVLIDFTHDNIRDSLFKAEDEAYEVEKSDFSWAQLFE